MTPLAFNRNKQLHTLMNDALPTTQRRETSLNFFVNHLQSFFCKNLWYLWINWISRKLLSCLEIDDWKNRSDILNQLAIIFNSIQAHPVCNLAILHNVKDPGRYCVWGLYTVCVLAVYQWSIFQFYCWWNLEHSHINMISFQPNLICVFMLIKQWRFGAFWIKNNLQQFFSP